MTAPDMLSRHGHRLIQIGVALFLFTSFEGFAVPYFPRPDLGRSVHTLSAFTGVLLVSLGLVWPRLRLGVAVARLAFWFLLFSALATVAAFLLAALWGAGGSHSDCVGRRTGERSSGVHNPRGDLSGRTHRDRRVRANPLGTEELPALV